MAEHNGDENGGDPCGGWNQALTTPRLLRMVRDNQDYCTESHCYNMNADAAAANPCACTCEDVLGILWTLVIIMMALMVMIFITQRHRLRDAPKQKTDGKPEHEKQDHEDPRPDDEPPALF